MTQKSNNGNDPKDDDFLSRHKATAEELGNETAKKQTESKEAPDLENYIQQDLENEPELQELLEYVPINKKGWRRFSSRVRQLIAQILLRQQQYRQKYRDKLRKKVSRKTREHETEREQYEYSSYSQRNKNRNQAARLRLNILRSLIHRKRQQIIRNIKQLKILRNFLFSQIKLILWQQTPVPGKKHAPNRDIQQAVINNQRAILNSQKASANKNEAAVRQLKGANKISEKVSVKITAVSNAPEGKNLIGNTKPPSPYAKMASASISDFRLVAELMFAARGVAVKFAKNFNKIATIQLETKIMTPQKPETITNIKLTLYGDKGAFAVNKTWSVAQEKNSGGSQKTNQNQNKTSAQPIDTPQPLSVSALKNKDGGGQISR